MQCGRIQCLTFGEGRRAFPLRSNPSGTSPTSSQNPVSGPQNHLIAKLMSGNRCLPGVDSLRQAALPMKPNRQEDDARITGPRKADSDDNREILDRCSFMERLLCSADIRTGANQVETDSYGPQYNFHDCCQQTGQFTVATDGRVRQEEQ